nr:2-hydroxymuconic semialdehyde hydrolase [uncultured bacterium]
MERTRLKTGIVETSLCRQGAGDPVLFIHGSGPGAGDQSNWQLALPALGDRFLCLAPDLVGYDQSTHPDPAPRGPREWMRLWVDQLIGLLDALNIEKVHLVGNSLGGAIALNLLIEKPERFGRAVLMGPAGAPMPATPELSCIWGFYRDPTVAAMKNAIRMFAYDEGFIADRLDDIATARVQAATRPEVARSFANMFPEPFDQSVSELIVPETLLERIQHDILILHGVQDRIVPLSGSIHLIERLPNATLTSVPRCSHWVQIERAELFHAEVARFLRQEKNT